MEVADADMFGSTSFMINLLVMYCTDIVLEAQTQILNIQRSPIQDTRSAIYKIYFIIFTIVIIIIIMIIITRGQSNLTKSASRGAIPRLGVTAGGRNLYH